MPKAVLASLRSGKELLNARGYADNPVLMAQNYGSLAGSFDSSLMTAIGTYTVVPAHGNNGIVLTDMIISAGKKQAATIEIQISDGVDTESLMLITLADQPVNFGHNFGGHWSAWKGASVQAVVAGASIAGCLSIGYYRTPEYKTLAYDAWVERRASATGNEVGVTI